MLVIWAWELGSDQRGPRHGHQGLGHELKGPRLGRRGHGHRCCDPRAHMPESNRILKNEI